MKVHQLSQNNHTSFNSRYKLPVSSTHVQMFERDIVSMYKKVNKEPIKAFYDKSLLYVFTGKDDVALFMSKRPKQIGIVRDTGNNKISSLNYEVTQHAITPFDVAVFRKKIKDFSFETLENLQELMTKLGV